jgi:diguanylate cyclase (GGDEF)-like protein
MDEADIGTKPSRSLSLRWKSLIAVSVALLVVNSALAGFAYKKFVGQFDREKREMREQQVRQFREIVDVRSQQVANLANFFRFLLRPARDARASVQSQIEHLLDLEGPTLWEEWEVSAVFFVEPDGITSISWPGDGLEMPDALVEAIIRNPQEAIPAFDCSPTCYQYTATPILGQIEERHDIVGHLVLVQSLARTLETFHKLTKAQAAIVHGDAHEVPDDRNARSDKSASLSPTVHEEFKPVLEEAIERLPKLEEGLSPASFQYGTRSFEVFRALSLSPSIDVLVVNDVSQQLKAIQQAVQTSVLIGLGGLLLSGGLLLLIIRGPLYRLRDLATVVPLLAENRYADLRGQLPQRSKRLMLRDEIDLMTDTVGNLTDRMELLQRDREQAEARLVWLADHDPLTQLYNRRRFNDDFERILDQARRFGHQGALLFLDLDQFKDVNDLSGHRVGDTLLQRVAEQLRLVTQTSDLLARLGGDEFALVLPEATEDDALSSAELIQEAVCSITLQEHGRRHRVTASIGIVMFPTQGNDVGQLMASADLAMYQAKEKGRGRWYLFSEEDQGKELLDARVLWREQINQALTQDRFELHVQPIIEVATGKVRHMEVLLRMRDARGGMVYPDRFIPVAERTGQIQAIDRWVIDNALSALSAQPELRLSINLSASAMDDPLLLIDMRRLFTQHGVAAERISFEVTETAAINSLLNATRLMHGLQELGCRFALDDFGSGYASYAYLRKLPVDEVKIDGAFVRDIAKNPEDRIFVKAITDMSHGMGKRVTAEFVENAEILAILKQLGVDDAQGYHFGRPARLEYPNLG